MENRRALYNRRHKIKNTHATYKLNKDEREKRLKADKDRGRSGRRPIVELEPSEYTKNAKTVLTEVCVICDYPMAAPSPICPQCGNCQACGKYSEDRYSNQCIHCGNHVDGPRLDDRGIIPVVGGPNTL